MSEFSLGQRSLDQGHIETNPSKRRPINFVDFIEKRFGGESGVAQRLSEMALLTKPFYTEFEDDKSEMGMMSIRNPNSYEVWYGGHKLVTTLMFDYLKEQGENNIHIFLETEEGENLNDLMISGIKKIKFSESRDSIIFLTANEGFRLSIEDGSVSPLPLDSFS
jgi:hypothetical protein